MTVLRKTATAALWCLASLGAQPAGAWAQDRALVIGIGTYENLPEDNVPAWTEERCEGNPVSVDGHAAVQA